MARPAESDFSWSRYVAWLIGILDGVGSIATIVITRLLTAKISPERPPGAVVVMAGHELNTPANAPRTQPAPSAPAASGYGPRPTATLRSYTATRKASRRANMANEIVAWLGRSGAVGAATYASTQLPGTASVLAYGFLGIVVLLVVLSSLPRSKARRDAARETLKMLLEYLRPSTRRSGDTSSKSSEDHS